MTQKILEIGPCARQSCDLHLCFRYGKIYENTFYWRETV